VETNVLYYGDNLDILRRYIPAESVDLVCLDPPFNSSQSYSTIPLTKAGASPTRRSTPSMTPRPGVERRSDTSRT